MPEAKEERGEEDEGRTRGTVGDVVTAKVELAPDL
jgi:hypothetical protein